MTHNYLFIIEILILLVILIIQITLFRQTRKNIYKYRRFFSSNPKTISLEKLASESEKEPMDEATE